MRTEELRELYDKLWCLEDMHAIYNTRNMQGNVTFIPKITLYEFKFI
jgi:hypothetical protein